MIEQFNNICNFRKIHPGIPGKGLTVNDPKLNEVKKDLQILKAFLELKFNNYRNLNFKIEVSSGQRYYPSILHVCILPPDQTVSNGIYSVICFDKFGRGALVGCAKSVTYDKELYTVTRKKQKTDLLIDVDGGRDTTKYNNAFHNPKEFYSGITTDRELIAHIKISLDLALIHLGISNLSTVLMEDLHPYSNNNDEFNPSSIEDGREKIRIQITARRGQKKFRDSILKAYAGKCAITGSNVTEVLEAAHILPYKGIETNHVQNGILLRSDIHLLFDLGLLTIDADTRRVKIHSTLTQTYYFQYNNQLIYVPLNVSDHPHIRALRYHNEFEFKK